MSFILRAITRPVFMVLTGLVCLGAPAHAFTRGELREAVGVLDEQLAKIDKMGDASCSDEHKKLNAAESLRISLFYGYENYDDITADSLHATAMTQVLLRKCSGHIEACGFRLVSRGTNKVRLERTIDGRVVTISIHSTSVSEVDADNSNFGRNQWNQYAQSQTVWKDFHRALRESDVVFYSGHSRVGSGLGFNIESLPQHAFNLVFKQPLNATLEALRARPSRLKLLGLMACTSDEYYRSAMQRANPNLSMIVSHAEIDADEGEQISIGTLNAILAKKCRRDMDKSMISVIEPAPGRMEYIRR